LACAFGCQSSVRAMPLSVNKNRPSSEVEKTARQPGGQAAMLLVTTGCFWLQLKAPLVSIPPP